MKKKKSKNIIKSLDKGLFLLEVIEESNAPMTLQELWLKLKWDKATIHRLLTTLENRGYLYRDPSVKGYTLGIKIHGLYASITRHLDIQKIIKPFLKLVVENTGETAHLAVVLENSIVFIDRESSSATLSVNTQIGEREPLHCTALGKAYLAAISNEELDDLLEDPLQQFTIRTIKSIDELKSKLKEIRKKGYAVDNEEYIDGVRCIASPILNQLNSPVALIGCSGPKHRISLSKCKEYGNYVKNLSIEISKRFGYQTGEINNESTAP